MLLRKVFCATSEGFVLLRKVSPRGLSRGFQEFIPRAYHVPVTWEGIVLLRKVFLTDKSGNFCRVTPGSC